MSISVPKGARLLEIDAHKAANLDGGSAKLYQNDITPNANTVLADFEECDFTGYADVEIVAWSASFLDPQGNAVVLGGLVSFAATGSAVTNFAYGIYYVDAGGAYLWGFRFPTPVGFAATGDTLAVVPKYQSGQIVLV